MKLTIALLLWTVKTAMAGGPPGGFPPGGGNGGGLATCTDQSDCLIFTVEKLEGPGDCSMTGNLCRYKICQTFAFGGSCAKGASDTVSHVCVKPDDVCDPPGTFGDYGDTDSDIRSGDEYCQIVSVGGTAEFLVKDANADGMCGSDTINIDGGIVATCGAFDGGNSNANSCSGGGNAGKECVWRVDAPETCNFGGVSGDPHIKLWNGTRYSYHGECDLVMLHSSEFADKLGFDLHIRTSIVDFYSFIESAALQIGESILEVTSGHFWVNGDEKTDDDLPMTIEGYTMGKPYMSGNAKIYRVDLNNGDHVNFRTYKHFLSVDVAASKEDFGNSHGLLGDFYNGDMVARDGSIKHTEVEFGGEWQVTQHEPKLFIDKHRAPQLPAATCVLPVATARHLRDDPKLLAAAEGACAHKGKSDFQFCVYDVLATGDMGMAGAW